VGEKPPNFQHMHDLPHFHHKTPAYSNTTAQLIELFTTDESGQGLNENATISLQTQISKISI